MSPGHVTIVTDNLGVRHEVPDIWIAGYCQGASLRGEASTVEAAVNAWLVHAWLAEQEARNGVTE